MTAAFEELYTGAYSPLFAIVPLIEATKHIEPSILYFNISRAQACAVRSTPV